MRLAVLLFVVRYFQGESTIKRGPRLGPLAVMSTSRMAFRTAWLGQKLVPDCYFQLVNSSLGFSGQTAAISVANGNRLQLEMAAA